MWYMAACALQCVPFPGHILQSRDVEMCVPCRAIVELQKAMTENSIARCPVLSAQYDGKDVRTFGLMQHS